MAGVAVIFGGIGFTIWTMIGAIFAGLDDGFAGFRKRLVIYTAFMMALGVVNGVLVLTADIPAPFFSGFLLFAAGWLVGLVDFAICHGCGVGFKRMRR